MDGWFFLGNRREAAGAFEESQHPRDEGGKFTSGPGGGGTATEEPPAKPQKAPDQPKDAPPEEAPASDTPSGGAGQKPKKHKAVENWKEHADKGNDTQKIYKDASGQYKPERQALHKDILDGMFQNVTPVENPTFYLTGGGPASGKSTMFKSGKIQLPDNMAKIDADHIKAQIPEYDEMKAAGDGRGAAFAHEESSDVAKEAVRRGVEGGMNTFLDGTGNSSIESLRAKLAGARAKGHRIVAHYATVDTDEAVRRSMAAAQNPKSDRYGRMVPESVIRSTHAAVSNTFRQALEEGLFDEVTLWDTSETPPKRLLAHVNGQTTFDDEEGYKKFLAKGEEQWDSPQKRSSALRRMRLWAARHRSRERMRSASTSRSSRRSQPSSRPEAKWEYPTSGPGEMTAASLFPKSPPSPRRSEAPPSDRYWWDLHPQRRIAGYEEPEACEYGPEVYGELDPDDVVTHDEPEELPISEIRGSAIKREWPSIDDGGTQHFLDLWAAGEYDEAEPIEVFLIEGEYWVWDGHSRFSMLKSVNPEGTVMAHVTERFPAEDENEGPSGQEFAEPSTASRRMADNPEPIMGGVYEHPNGRFLIDDLDDNTIRVKWDNGETQTWKRRDWDNMSDVTVIQTSFGNAHPDLASRRTAWEACPTCLGSGTEATSYGDHHWDIPVCRTCGGSGRAPKPPDDEDRSGEGDWGGGMHYNIGSRQTAQYHSGAVIEWCGERGVIKRVLDNGFLELQMEDDPQLWIVEDHFVRVIGSRRCAGMPPEEIEQEFPVGTRVRINDDAYVDTKFKGKEAVVTALTGVTGVTDRLVVKLVNDPEIDWSVGFFPQQVTKIGYRKTAALPRAVQQYINSIRNTDKRDYAERYATYLIEGGIEPPDYSLSYMAAQAVRMRLEEIMTGDAKLGSRQTAEAHPPEFYDENPPDDWEECPECEMYHPPGFTGDCREDLNRWPDPKCIERLKHGEMGVVTGSRRTAEGGGLMEGPCEKCGGDVEITGMSRNIVRGRCMDCGAEYEMIGGEAGGDEDLEGLTGFGTRTVRGEQDLEVGMVLTHVATGKQFEITGFDEENGYWTSKDLSTGQEGAGWPDEQLRNNLAKGLYRVGMRQHGSRWTTGLPGGGGDEITLSDKPTDEEVLAAASKLLDTSVAPISALTVEWSGDNLIELYDYEEDQFGMPVLSLTRIAAMDSEAVMEAEEGFKKYGPDEDAELAETLNVEAVVVNPPRRRSLARLGGPTIVPGDMPRYETESYSTVAFHPGQRVLVAQADELGLPPVEAVVQRIDPDGWATVRMAANMIEEVPVEALREVAEEIYTLGERRTADDVESGWMTRPGFTGLDMSLQGQTYQTSDGRTVKIIEPRQARPNDDMWWVEFPDGHKSLIRQQFVADAVNDVPSTGWE